jgi:hypothetical protein
MTTTTKKANWTQISIWLLGSFTIASLLVFFFLCILNNPIADDYAYFADLRSRGTFGFLEYHYLDHSGRFGQALLVTLGWVFFGVISVKVMPLLLIIALGLSLSWLVWRFLPLERRNKPACCAIGFTIAAAVLVSMLSFYDSVLWWTASSIYLSSIIVLVLDAIFIHFLMTTKKVKAWQFALIVLFIVFGQGFSEIASVIAGLGGITLGIILLVKKNWLLVRRLLIVGAAMALGFALVYFSGGSMRRQSADAIGNIQSIWQLVFVAPAWFAKIFINNYHWWQGILLLAVGGVIAPLLKKISRRQTMIVSGAIIVTTLATTYIIFLFNSYIGWMDLRAYTAVCFIGGLATITLAALWFGHILHTKYRALAYVTPLVLMFIAVAPTLFWATGAIKGQAIRDYFFDHRSAEIATQLESGSSTVITYSLPVIVPERVGASDVWDKPEQGSWTEGAFRAFFLIPRDIHLFETPSPYSAQYRDSY